MLPTLMRSLAAALVSLLVLSFVVFVATNAVPGSAARANLGKTATPEQVREFNRVQGLDRPVLARYGAWLSRTVQLDFGNAIATGRPVSQLIGPRLERSALLAVLGFAVAAPFALAVGLYAGKRAGRRSELGVSFATLVVGAMPEFVIGLVLVTIFAVWAGVLPLDSTALVLTGSDPTDRIKAYVLPVLTVAVAISPYLIRLMRANTREVVSEPYVRAGVLRGVAGRRLNLGYLLPNALPPVVNGMAITLASMLGGLVTIETVFAYPGVGQLLVQSVSIKDLPVIQAVALIAGAAFIALNLLADLIVVGLTPRLRHAG